MPMTNKETTLNAGRNRRSTQARSYGFRARHETRHGHDVPCAAHVLDIAEEQGACRSAIMLVTA